MMKIWPAAPAPARRRGTAQQRDELAPSHVCSLSPKVTPYHIVVWNAALCITANSAANVSVGSIALMGTAIIEKGRSLLLPRSFLEYQRAR
jgi:hypothetical protein